MYQAISNALSVLPVIAFLAMSFGLVARSEAQGGAVLYEEPIPLNDLELAGFHRILKTTPAQQTATKALYDASFAELKAAEARAGVVAQKYLSLPKEQRTPSAREQHLRDVAAAGPDIPAARRRLLNDLKALLTIEQLERWRAFEMFLRREAWRADSRGIARQQTNLLALVEPLGPDAVPAESRMAAEAALERYAIDLDLVIIEADRIEQTVIDARSKAAAAKRAKRDNPEASDAREQEALTAAFASFKAANLRIVQLNDAAVEAFARFLSPQNAAELRMRYERAMLPEAYRSDFGAEAIRLAPQLPGLDEPTRDRLRAIAREFQPNYDALCDRIGTMERVLRRGKPEERSQLSDWDAVRKSRHELVAETLERLRKIVTEEQHQAILMAGQRAVNAQTAASSR